MLGELFPPAMRGLGAGVSTCVGWSCAFLVTETFPIVLSHTDAAVFWIFSGICVVGTIFVFLRLPETKVLLCFHGNRLRLAVLTAQDPAAL